MIIRFARHGQPALEGMPKGANHEFPPRDYVLSPLGRQQAEFLGGHLKKIGFRGKVISSPYVRTVETASIAAGICGLDIYLEPRIQEMRFYEEPPCPGMKLEELRVAFPNIAADAELVYPWMTPGGAEVLDTVRARVDKYVEELIADPPADDVLLVGHGASLQSLKWNFYERSGYTGKDHHNWNCSMSTFEVDRSGKAKMIEIARYDFMPLEYVTSNKRLFGDPECV